MAEPTNYRYGVIQSLDEAREAATEAESEDLRGYYPAACVVLARELKRWEDAHNEWLERSSAGVAPTDDALNLTLNLQRWAELCEKGHGQTVALEIRAAIEATAGVMASEAPRYEQCGEAVVSPEYGVLQMSRQVGLLGLRDEDRMRGDRIEAVYRRVAAGVTVPLTDDRISNHEQPLRQDNAPGHDGGDDRASHRSGELRHGATEPDGAVGVVDGRQGAARAHDAAGPAAVPAGADASRVAIALLPRIDAAIQRIVNGQGCMRIPADPEDPDLVLADCKRLLSHVYGVTPTRHPQP